MVSEPAPFGLVDVAATIDGATGDRAAGMLASGQHGLVTTSQLRVTGLGREAIAHRVRRGRLFRVHRGVYLLGHRSRTDLTGPAAAILALGPSAVLSHWTAAWLWQMLDDLPELVHLSVSSPSARSRPGIQVHRAAAMDKRDLRRRRGLPLLAPAATLLDLADGGDAVEVERALNEGRQRRLITQNDLEQLLRRAPGRRGLAILLPLFRSQTNEDFSRKEAERILWNLIRSAGLPAPRRNFRIHGFELDFFWPEIGLNVETDGYEWHSARNRLNADRDRDSRLSALGIQVIRFTWDQLRRPEQVVARLAAAIAIASERRHPARIS